MPKFTPPPSQRIKHTDGYLSLAQAAAQLGTTSHTLYTAVRRGTVKPYYLPGQGRTGWQVYLRESDVQALQSAPPSGSLISIKEASRILGTGRAGINHLVYRRILHKIRKPFVRGQDQNTVWFDRTEVEHVVQQRATTQLPGLPAGLVKMLNSKPHLTIADVLLRRPPGVTDAAIARAFGVSRQRVHQIKQKIAPNHG